MCISILVMFSTTSTQTFQTTSFLQSTNETFVFSRFVKNQIIAFCLGTVAFIFMAAFDYRKLREWTWFLYIGMLIALFGLYFTTPIHNVYRWYRLPLIPFDFQPSEYMKLVLVITLSWFLEKRVNSSESTTTFLWASLLVIFPFLLIVKQPDLGTACILIPISLVIFYFGGIRKSYVKALLIGGLLGSVFILLVFLGVFPHEQMRPFFAKFLKEYQYERLNPHTYHGRAAQTAIALGSFSGSGFGKSSFTGHDWLPYAYTDSVFAAFTEEFGLFGAFFVLFLFFSLIYCSFQVTRVARDYFGRLLSAGISVYLAMHVIINVGMMCGLLPITGVPLLLVSYGGSSVLSTMIALGILQSIYSRRFTFS